MEATQRNATVSSASGRARRGKFNAMGEGWRVKGEYREFTAHCSLLTPQEAAHKVAERLLGFLQRAGSDVGQVALR